MIINEYNDTSLPKVVLLHGMGMDGRTMRLVTEGMSREYCLIIPDLTGQGRDTGTYESTLAEAEALTVYLLERGYTDVELLMGVSLGANVGMTMLAFPEVHYRTAVFEGAPMYEGSKFVAPMMKEAFYLLRAHMLRRPKDKLQAGMMKILGNAPDPRVDEAVGAFIDAFRNISKETIFNVCDEVGDYPFYPIEPAVQDRVFLEFGSKDMNCGQVPNIKRHYPYVHVKINEGYAHCGYVVANLATYGAHLEEYMATYSDEGSSPVPSDEAGLAPLSKIRAVVGTNAWGGSLYGKALRGSYVDEDVLGQAARAAVEAGIPILDTAEDYGLGKCQPIVGRVCDGDVLISSKYTPMSKRYKPGQVRASLARDLREMGRDRVDVYWLHLPNAVEENLAEMAELYREGRIRNIGVSNFDREEVGRAKAFLDGLGIPLYGVQNHYSLLARDWESNGLVAWCRENGVVFWAWAVLEEGLLAGPRAQKGAMDLAFASKAQRLAPLYAAMDEVGDAHGITTAQVAIAFVAGKGIVPICGCRRPAQVDQLAEAAGAQLAEDEITELEAVADATGAKVLGADLFRFAVR